MYFEAKQTPTYKSQITSLSAFTALFGIGCSIFGYIFLPLAAAFYAALLVVEEKKRIFSILIPAVVFIVNFVINGFYSLEGIAYVIFGLLIFYSYTKSKSKAATTFLLTALAVIMILISFTFILFNAVKGFDVEKAMELLSSVYDTVKDKVVDSATSIIRKADDGTLFFILNASEAEQMFNSSVYILIPVLILFAFLITGVSFKLFEGRILRYTDSKEKILDWKMTLPSSLAYFFIVISIIAMFSSDGLFGISISCLDLIFTPIFCYFGIRMAKAFFNFNRGTSALFLVAAIVIAPAVAIRVLAYLGVFYTISANKRHSGTDEA